MKKETNVKELAKIMVGDGKRPNKWFLTVAYGWYMPVNNGAEDDRDMEQVADSLDSITMLFNNKEDADTAYDAINLTASKMTGSTIGQVILEDRLTGVVKDKYLEQTKSNSFSRYIGNVTQS